VSDHRSRRRPSRRSTSEPLCFEPLSAEPLSAESPSFESAPTCESVRPRNLSAPPARATADTRPGAPTAGDDPYAAAREVALRQLTAGPRTRAQLVKAITSRGLPQEVAVQVVDRLEEVELVDDEQFADQWVRSRRASRGLARRALGQELRQRGVAEPLVRQALARVGPPEELAAAQDLVRRRLRATAADDPDRRMRRLLGMLARRGYDSGTAMRAVRAVLAEEHPELTLPEEDSDPGPE
jgi:regulatory protein